MRLFVAIPVSTEVSAALVGYQSVLSPMGPFSMVPAKNMHMTLKFIGEADEETLEKVDRALASIRAEPFEMGLEGIGAFPNPKKVKVIWAALCRGSQQAVKLAREVDERLGELGFQKEGRFHPHITLARSKGGQDRDGLQKLLVSADQPAFGAFMVDGMSLMKSELHPDGARHEVLRSYAFG